MFVGRVGYTSTQGRFLSLLEFPRPPYPRGCSYLYVLPGGISQILSGRKRIFIFLYKIHLNLFERQIIKHLKHHVMEGIFESKSSVWSSGLFGGMISQNQITIVANLL